MRKYTAIDKAWKWDWWEKDCELSVGGEYQLDVTGNDDDNPLYHFQIPIIVEAISENSVTFIELDTKHRRTAAVSPRLIITPKKTDREKHIDRVATMMYYTIHGYEPSRFQPNDLVIHDWFVCHDLARGGFEPTITRYQELDSLITKN